MKTSFTVKIDSSITVVTTYMTTLSHSPHNHKLNLLPSVLMAVSQDDFSSLLVLRAENA